MRKNENFQVAMSDFFISWDLLKVTQWSGQFITETSQEHLNSEMQLLTSSQVAVLFKTC